MHLVVTLVGLVCLVDGLWNAVRVPLLYRYGGSAPGEVLQVYEVRPRRGADTWVMVYQYRVGVQTFTGRIVRPRSSSLPHSTGDAIHVLYLTVNPRKSIVYPPLP
jgi:hypothetical protein